MLLHKGLNFAMAIYFTNTFFTFLFSCLFFLSLYPGVSVSGADVINFDGQGVISYRFKVLCLLHIYFYIRKLVIQSLPVQFVIRCV